MDILETSSQEDTEPCWKEPDQVPLSTDTGTKLADIEPQAHMSPLRKAPPDMGSRADTGDLPCGGHQGRLLPPKTLIKASYLKHETLSPSLFFFSFILPLAWKDKASICTYQATDKGVTFPTAGFVLKDFNLSIMLGTS